MKLFFYLLLSYLIFRSVVIKSQTVISGGFEDCSATPIIASGNSVQTHLAGCTTNYGFSGVGYNFYDNSSSLGVSVGSCPTILSPPAYAGLWCVGIGNLSVVSVKLSAPLVIGKTYDIFLYVNNNQGDDGSGAPCTLTPEAINFGTSTSPTSFGTSIGTSTLINTSLTFSQVKFQFTASSADTYLTFQLANQANDNSILFLDEISLLTPFTCSDARYVSQGSPITLTTINLDGTYSNIGSPTGLSFNAIGYNILDNYIYFPYRASTTNTTIPMELCRVDANGVVYNLGTISGLANANYPSGCMDNNGYLYIKKNAATNELFKIKVSDRTYTTIVLTASVSTNDMAFNPINGFIYYQDITSGKIGKINSATGAVTVISTAIYLPAGFGSFFSDQLGNIYGNDNAGGFYQFDTLNGQRLLIQNSGATGNNDGTMCMNSAFIYPANLAITKTDGVADYTPGTSTTYTIVVSNTGTTSLMNAKITDLLPAGISASDIASITYSIGGPAPPATTPPTSPNAGTNREPVLPATPSTYIINDVIDLLAGGTITYIVTINIPATFTGNLINTATIIAPTNVTDAILANNVASDIDLPLSNLPIELIYFNAECSNNNEIIISWQTASETNNQLFTLQKSYNGIEWRQVTELEGALNSTSIKSYSYTDSLTTSRTLYYRLKQTDAEGSYKYSQIIDLTCKENDKEFNIYPNPNNGEFQIDLNRENINEYRYEMHTVLGQITSADLLRDNSNLISTKHLPDGIYCLTIYKSNTFLCNKTIIIKND